MAEVHFIGEVSYGREFGGQSYFCVWEIITGNQWIAVEGHTSGCTHIMRNGEDGIHWNFPIDVHYSFTSALGWPKISIQVWQIDGYGRKDLAGYGTAFLPVPDGKGEGQEVEIVTWKPASWHPNAFMRFYKALRLLVMGGNPVLRDNSLIHSNEERFKLHTFGSGSVIIDVTVLTRGMKHATITSS